MCGIAGEVGLANGRSRTISAQLSTLRHRGPDAEGAFECEGAWVGQTRLAVIDLEHGDPPVANEDRTVGVALNGEIYNYRDLRSSLRKGGHTFTTQGDTEVIAHLVEDLDPAAVANALEGMFAFAAWDDRRKTLILGRDRFGKKPLYYWHDRERLIFASEIKALLANPQVPRRLRTDAIPDYLTFGYVPTPETFFEGIHSVPPGHVLIARPGDEPKLERYWEPQYPGASSTVERSNLTLSDAAAEVRETLTAAVQRRLIADVPLGAFLSGGIDSSAVVALMAQATTQPVATFTIGFDDFDGYDERPYARAVARRYGTEHTEFVVNPDASELIERLVWHYDQPFGDSSALPTFVLSELTRDHVTVALCGDGGDELFAGYERFAAALAVARYEAVPQAVRLGARRVAELLPSSASSGRMGKVRRLLVRSDLPAPMALLAWVSYVPVEWKERLLANGSLAAAVGDGTEDGAGMRSYQDIWRRSAGAHPLDRLLDLNIRTYLVDDLLPKVDRMSMAHALEVRAPFLDRELAELAFRLPPAARARGLSLKRVLRAAVGDLLPPEILQRPKRGFGVPLDRWFRQDLAAYVQAMLATPKSRVRGYLRGEAIDALVAEHQAGAANHGDAIWSLLTLEVFLRRHDW